MARYSDRDIPNDMSIDWSNDPYYNLPFSGRAVQKFIKDRINEKASTGYLDTSGTTMKLLLFKDEVDKAEYIDDTSKDYLIVGTIPMEFGTTQFRIRVTPEGSTTVNVSINQEHVYLRMALQAETKEIDERQWNPTGDDIVVAVYADINNTGRYEEIPELHREVNGSDGYLELDIRNHLVVGTSRFRLLFTDKQDPSITASIVWNVTMAEMYIENANNTWYRAIVENGYDSDYKLGGFKIVGAIAKTLHITISTSMSLVAYYELDLSTTEYIEREFIFDRNRGLALTTPVSREGISLPALETGVYNVRVWLTSGALSTEANAVSYNIMYVAPGDEASSLVVMNNAGKTVNNYDESAHLCDYAIYNGGSQYGNPTITVTSYIDGTPSQPDVSSIQVQTGTIRELNYKIELYTNGTISIKYKIEMEDNYQEMSSPVDNTETFPAESGASFYLNTSVRSNGDSDREDVYNTARGKEKLNYVEWQGMSWVDGVDGWTKDDNGRSCLFIPAGSKLTIPAASYLFLTGQDVAFELCYKVLNVSDYTENVISIADGAEEEGFTGIRIRPTNVTVHSTADTSSGNDIYRGTNIVDEEVVHLLVTIRSNFDTINGKNIVTGYINGCKNFQFDYSGAGWSSPVASAIFGSSTADLYLYMVRVYRNKLADSSAEKNWINTLETRDEKVSNNNNLKSVLRESTRQISYEKIKNEEKYNFFVVEMTGGSSHVPSYSFPNGGRANIEMHYGKDSNGNSRSTWDWKIYDVETKGQGTTSMNYWLWNIRSRIDKTDDSGKRMVAYYDVPVIENDGSRRFVELPAENSKTVWFDGSGNHPAVKRITAKINFASSMQSHKMGATAAYNALHDNVFEGELLNYAQRYAAAESLPAPSVAVYQYPAIGFEKIGNEYTFIGLFTIGPDKGDKPTFGYDLVPKADLITLEGVDHEPSMARFCIPWDEQIIYTHTSDKDCLSIKDKGFSVSGNFQEAFEASNVGTADTKMPEQAMPILESKFKDAYSVIYDNSTLIFPVSLSDETWGGEDASEVLTKINSNTELFRTTLYGTEQRLKYSDMEFWIEGEYILYHYEIESEQYVSGYKASGVYGSPLDLRSDTGVTASQLAECDTLEEQNDLFKQARRQRFISEAPTYWNMNELAFNYAFLLIFAATDNFAKNQYPQYMGAEDKWRFRQDDLDTIEDIDNNGGQTKPSDLEFQDAINGYAYFAGSNSILWNLVHESMWADFTSGGTTYHGINSTGKNIIETMYDLSHGINYYDGFVKFFDVFFWGKAQEYFPQSAYNIDGNIKYEDAWLWHTEAPRPGPLPQSLGNHYSAEKLWVKRRALYCMSLFSVGAFASEDEGYLGRMQFRPIDLGGLTVTVAQSMYPCMFVGTNKRATSRILSGQDYTFTGLTASDARYTINALDNITSLGDLKDIQISPEDGYAFGISGKKLRTIKLGDEDGATTNIRSFTITDPNGMPCLEVVDVSNASDLTGTLNLSNCRRVREVYAEGTKLTSITLPRGSKIEKLHLPDTISRVSYQVVKFLYDLQLPEDTTNIELVYLDECNALNGMSTLEDIYSVDGNKLYYIKIYWDTEQSTTGGQIRMLAHIAQDLDKYGNEHHYYGVGATGDGDILTLPYLEGRLVGGKHYMSDINVLSGGVTPSDSEVHPGMKEISVPTTLIDGGLKIAYPTGNEYEYVEFIDSVVRQECSDTWGDGTGVTYTQAAAVTSLGGIFNGNQDITSFDELKNFSSIGAMLGGSSASGEFSNCDSLESISFPTSLSSIGGYAFSGCSNLSEITFNSSALTIQNAAFYNCGSVSRVNIRSISDWCSYDFASNTANPFGTSSAPTCGLYINDVLQSNIEIPERFTSIGGQQFYNLNTITSVTIPSSVTQINIDAFNGCSGISGSVIVPSSVKYIGMRAFANCSSITNLVLPVTNSRINASVVQYSGNGTGTLWIKGSMDTSLINGDLQVKYKNVIIEAAEPQTSTRNLINTASSPIETLRIGTFDSGECTSAGIVNGSTRRIKFFELKETASGSSNIFRADVFSDNAIIHLGYDTVSNNALPCEPEMVKADSSYVSNIYVGDGTSPANDNAILAMYIADTGGWANYSSKLDTWYNYINSPDANPDYVNLPTIPSV